MMKKPKPNFIHHDDDVIVRDWKARLQEGTPAFDFLMEIIMERIDGGNRFERGIQEGRRRLAGDIIGYVLSDERAT
jgi:hypothetical protein